MARNPFAPDFLVYPESTMPKQHLLLKQNNAQCHFQHLNTCKLQYLWNTSSLLLSLLGMWILFHHLSLDLDWALDFYQVPRIFRNSHHNCLHSNSNYHFLYYNLQCKFCHIPHKLGVLCQLRELLQWELTISRFSLLIYEVALFIINYLIKLQRHLVVSCLKSTKGCERGLSQCWY